MPQCAADLLMLNLQLTYWKVEVGPHRDARNKQRFGNETQGPHKAQWITQSKPQGDCVCVCVRVRHGAPVLHKALRQLSAHWSFHC